MATESQPSGHWRRYRVFYAVVAVCAAPVVASYVAYYVLPPSGRTNYGRLVDPQRPVPDLAALTLDGQRFDLRNLAGQWILISVDRGECEARCGNKLLAMRQQRLMAGKDRERIERVWLITDSEPLSTLVMREYEGTHFVRAPIEPLQSWLAPAARSGLPIQDAIFLVDPLGNLMMAWSQPYEPTGMKRDLERLLRASSGWLRIEKNR